MGVYAAGHVYQCAPRGHLVNYHYMTTRKRHRQIISGTLMGIFIFLRLKVSAKDKEGCTSENLITAPVYVFKLTIILSMFSAACGVKI